VHSLSGDFLQKNFQAGEYSAKIVRFVKFSNCASSSKWIVLEYNLELLPADSREDEMNDMGQKDYYQILGIEKNAMQDQIRQAYRKLAFQYHPDKNKGDPAATEKMKEINEAYAILSDSTKRREYDLLRERYGPFAYERYRQAHSPGDIFRGSDIDRVFEEFAKQFGFRSFSEIFREFYGAEYQSFEFQKPGMFGKGFVFYRRPGSRAEGQEANLSQGALPELPLPGPIRSLVKYLFKRVTGLEFPERGKDWKDTITFSPQEAQEGAEIEYHYKKWGKPRNLVVKVPAGTKDGQQIRLKGMGGPGKGGGGSGDLYLRVKIKVPLWQRIKSILK
jgi:DnaJ-class molecular chaperone